MCQKSYIKHLITQWFLLKTTQTGPVWLQWSLSICHSMICLISHSKEMSVFISYPLRLRASGEAPGEPSLVPSCLGTNKRSDTAVDRLMLHLYSVSTTGEGSVVLCPNHNNKVLSLNDGSRRAEAHSSFIIQPDTKTLIAHKDIKMERDNNLLLYLHTSLWLDRGVNTGHQGLQKL